LAANRSQQVFISCLVVALPLALLIAVFWLASTVQHDTEPGSPALRTASKTSSKLPPPPRPPAPEPKPDFAKIKDIDARKAAFVAYLMPAIRYHNQQLAWQRELLLAIQSKLESGEPLSRPEKKHLAALQEQFGSEEMPALLRRVNQIPASLALAQAATESGWGSSRFAREGNNFYGQWCYVKGCGIVPAQRPEGDKHEVKRFASPLESVAAYFNNINSNKAYRPLRLIRAQLHKDGDSLTGVALAAGLENYSQRGQAYVQSIRGMIRNNGWQRFDSAGDDSGEK